MDIYFKETGKNNPETIVFIHGGGISGWMWDEQVAAFSKYHCIIPDLPEHGRSMNVKPFTIKGAAEMIIKIIQDNTKGGKAHLVGISLGAQIIVQIMSMVPDVVDHVLISGTLLRTVPYSKTLLKLLDYSIKVYEPVKDTDFFIKANMRTYNMPKKYFESFKESTYLIEHDGLERVLKENMFFRLPDGLDKVESPVLVMLGEKDYKIIKESSMDLLNILPNSMGAIALKLGHLWNLESPELFNRILMAWINDQDIRTDLIPNFNHNLISINNTKFDK